jgi:hypothetical protein
MATDRDLRVAQFNVALSTTSDKLLLDTAEAAGRVGGIEAAASACATLIGYPFLNYDSDIKPVIRNAILNRLRDLRATAQALSYSWYV